MNTDNRRQAMEPMETRRRRDRTEEPFVCRECGGPARAYRGNVHGWTCAACIDRYLDEQASQ